MASYLQDLSTVQEVYGAIHKETEISEVGVDVDEYIDFIQTQLAEAKRYHPWMHDVDEEDLHDWAMKYEAQKMNSNRIVTPPTSELIASGLAGPYTIGKLYGQTTLKLLPGIGTLPASEIPVPGWSSRFEYALTDSCAISYPDGHPPFLWDPCHVLSSSSPKNRMSARFKAEDDEKLRRFAALGWVIMQDLGGVWQKTGHVMVIDMDDRNVRHRQPWLVLASEWPADGQDLPDGGFSFYAPETVRRDDRNQAGVFPGDNNRTTICRIVPQGRKERPGEIVLFQLGENFKFAPVRKGGHRDWRRTDRGPELARSMDWYFDPETKEQVCYNKQGREWLRYNQASKEYYFPQIDVGALKGEVGFYGELSGLPVAEIPRHQWKAYEDHEQELRDLGYEPPLPGHARTLIRTVGTWPGF